MPDPNTPTLEWQEQIVQTALELINKCDVTRLSTAGIAEKVGIAPSDLQHHFIFIRKDAIIDAALDLILLLLL